MIPNIDNGFSEMEQKDSQLIVLYAIAPSLVASR